jgi:hypothetical protein
MSTIPATVSATLIFVVRHRQSPGHHFITCFSNGTVTRGGQVTVYVIEENESFTVIIGRAVSVSVNAQVYHRWVENGLVGHFISCIFLLIVVLGLVSLHDRLLVEGILVFGGVGHSSSRQKVFLEMVVICVGAGWDGTDRG